MSVINQLLIADRKAVRESFGKSDKDVLTDIGIIKEWLKTQPHLPETPSDNVIELFLVTNKFSIERTKQRLDMYYTIRTLIPEVYVNSNPRLPEIQSVPDKMGLFVPLPKPSKELHRVYVMKVMGDPDDFDTYKFFANSLNVMEVRIHYDIAIGDVYIIDYDDLKMAHVMKMTPVHIKKVATVSEKVFSSRIKGIHLINCPSYVDILTNIAKMVLKPKIVNRIHLHSNYESLHAHVPKEILPKDYGGNERSIKELGDLWKSCLMEHADRFDKLDAMKVKEELRPTPLENDDILGGRFIVIMNRLLITDRKVVRESFGKSDKDVLVDIGIIKEWLKTQPHLPETPSDNVIEMFLVTNKFSIERTKQRLDMYYTIRTLIPEIYQNSNPRLPEMRNITEKMGLFVPLPKPSKELHRVYVMKIVGDPEDFDTYKFFANALNMMDVRLHYDIVVGDVYIIDYENLKMGHVVKMTPVHIKKVVTVSEKVFSSRIKGIHLINCPSYVDTLVNISKMIMKPKIANRMYFHSNYESLYEHVPKEMLPKDYGGNERSVKEFGELWKDCLLEHAERFDKLDTMKVKEELRPTPLENDDILGYHGNFKKLDVD
ncbi:hypothetical protein NQ315_007372 [Exocentrus adspersus]|uniref:CRAL-TRIO domain-containing protein n=1 Tax=Exocentrus adspersus TaxID=1586481 RepID=A0AAV8VI38_9CUCU|nr:hypothetical protein NQ315_007372 [Exocentrus adspersus]